MRALGLKALPVLLLSACAVGPHYAGPPIVPASSQWAEPARTSEPEANWWQGLHDATLDRLVSEARGRNLDVRIAREQLLEARATARAAIGSRFPELDATGSVTRNEVSRNGEIPIGRIPGFPRRFNLFDAGFDASWEIDLWGHTARAVEAAEARSAAAADTALAIELETVAEVVSNYVTLRSAQARLASAEADEVARRQTAALVRARFEAGESSKVDLSRAESQADAAAGDVPGLRAQARAATYSLAVLTGRTPEASLTLDETPQPLPAPPPAVGAGLRSDVLRRRPDVRQAERELAAATADVGVAVADLFPRVTLVAAIGQQAQH